MKKNEQHHRSVKAKKHLGQHFLRDDNIARKIADSLRLDGYEQVLEIGPGTGVLTKHLLQKNVAIYAMDIDAESIRYLRDHFQNDFPETKQNPRFYILEADFLKTDLSQLFPDKSFAITGNFPYNISSQILFKTIENREQIPEFTGMFQKEVARRICEKPGSKTYGILSVLAQAFYRTEYLFSVPPGVFLPPPKVDSGVIRLIRKEQYQLPCDEKLFFKIVKQSFQQRRKTLRNSLKNFNLSPKLKEDCIFDLRPEQLDVPQFVHLTQKMETDAI